MVDVNDDSDQFVDVPMGSSGFSRNKIGSDNFGPCIFFLLDVMHGDTSQCLLIHYSYDCDEIGLRKEFILEGILNRLYATN